MSFSNKIKKRIVFLDRDGVVNIEKGRYVFEITDFEFVSGLFEALSHLKKNGFEFIIITNQGGISKGLYSKKQVDILNVYIQKEFEKHNIPLLDILYCPHHNEIENCICRKPNSGLFEKAIAIYNVDTKHSVMVGDNDRDTEASEKVGISGIKMNKNSNLNVYIQQIIQAID
ncbi:MAG: HAD family hydrolase [Flavobacteriales bacterium]|nr:HAD family hydrolase [Flavobacteriales bacterium]